MKIKGVNTEHMKILSNSLILVFLASMVVLPANAALQAVGPISTAHGFPVFYQDTTGLALQPCLGVNVDGTGLADPNCILLADATFNPALPVSFPTNFPLEAFYWIIDANVLTVGTAGANLAFRETLEGSFATAAPAIDQQTAFLRINMRVSKVGGANGLTPNSTYTVTHPFGTFTCTTDALGNIITCVDAAGNGGGVAADFRTEDLASPPLNATAASILPAPNTLIGPFLRAVTPAPPAGYIGSPLVLQTIQPGPSGANLTITGPNIGGVGVNTVTTNQWFVAGKIAVIDTIPPTIVSAGPVTVAVGATNVVAGANITDNLGVTSATIDLGAFGNNFTATLNGAQEVPPTASSATGTGTFTIDTAANTLSFNITFSPLQGGAETGAHIHGPAVAGVNAPIVFSLPPGSPKTGVWNYPEVMEADILAGRMYTNIHSTLFPGGEIRGQILPTSNVQNMILTTGTKLNGTWSVVIPSVTRAGTFNLPIAATDGSNITTGNLVLNVVANGIVTAVPTTVIANNTTSVTITVTQGGAPVSNATVDLTGAVLPAPLTGTTDAAGNATFSVSPTTQGTITVTANSPSFLAPGTATITAAPPFVRGDANGNNVLDVADTLFCLQTVAGLRTLNAVQTSAADVNGNGVVDVVDGLFIAQFVAGIRTTL